MSISIVPAIEKNRCSSIRTDLIEDGGRVVGVRVKAESGEQEVRGDLVVAADGRHSVLRQKAGRAVHDLGAPMDVLWFRLSRQPSDTTETMGRFNPGAIMVMINRGTYWQCAYVIQKGGIEEIKAQELPAFKGRLAKSLPISADRADEIASWDDVKLLTVAVDRLEQWHKPGLLCIGDAAHAMSPIGGVGVNLAVQDAVAAANILAAPLREGRAENHQVTDHESIPKYISFGTPARGHPWTSICSRCDGIITTPDRCCYRSDQQCLCLSPGIRRVIKFPALCRCALVLARTSERFCCSFG
jgi:flavin-dependent dehydrogenase